MRELSLSVVFLLLLFAACSECGWRQTTNLTLLVPFTVPPAHGPIEQQIKNLYGGVKSAILSLISLDNKLRYCLVRGAQCRLLLNSQNGASLVPHRIQKIDLIAAAISRRHTRDRQYLYVDADVVIVSPLADLFSHRFHAVGKALGLALDLPQPSTITPKSRKGKKIVQYQTGVMYLNNRRGMMEILRSWRELHSILRAKSSPHNNVAVGTVQDSAKWDSDQYLLNHLLQHRKDLLCRVEVIEPRKLYNAFPNYHLDGIYAQSRPFTHQPVQESKFSALANGELWKAMRLPVGDEIYGESKLVHFAGWFAKIPFVFDACLSLKPVCIENITGLYGGAVIETGASDDAVALLAVKGYAVRHLHFLHHLANMPSHVQRNYNGSFVFYSTPDTTAYFHTNQSYTIEAESRTNSERRGRVINGSSRKPRRRSRHLGVISLISVNLAIGVMERIVNQLNVCVEKAYSKEFYESTVSIHCLEKVLLISKVLFMDYDATILRIKMMGVI